jgi:hypothetical protein
MTISNIGLSVSRRTALAGLGAGGLAGLALAVPARRASAQEATPASFAGHPLVGTWFLEVDADPTNALQLFIIHADGTYVEAWANGNVRLGVWAPTGPTTGTLTITAYTEDPATGANLGAETVRLTVTLDPGGDSYHAVGTLEHTRPDGSLSGQAGPATGYATRMKVEAPGTPVMTVAELFAAPAATPEATATP